MKHSTITSLSETAVNAYVVPLFKDESVFIESILLASLSPDARTYIQKVASGFSATLGKMEKVILPGQAAETILLVGLGDRKKYTLRKYILAMRSIVKGMRGARIVSAVLEPSALLSEGMSLAEGVARCATNMEMANYDFVQYKQTPEEGWYFVEEMVYLTNTENKDAVNTSTLNGAVVGEYIAHARDLSNTPGGDMTPGVLADSARSMAEAVGVSCTIIEEKEMAELGMGGILGVSKGSVEDAKLIVMEYHGADKEQKPLVFLGKGITFDSGGLDLKPGHYMHEMHMDMTGAASVISAVCAIAKLGIKVNIVGICPAVENMPSGESYRPGDLLKSMSGKSIEVLSPDAEGRIVLADALTYTEKRYDPALVVDLATLTGACEVAFGAYASAVLCPDDIFAQELCAVGERSGDYMWPLPMWEEYEDGVKGTFGDVINASNKRPNPGAINGGMFLYQFAKAFTKWAHIDIASTMTTSEGQFLSKGASGTGVRFLVELAWSKSL